jgi:ATP-dependent RNA helicase UAP56/SUB2
MSAQDNEELIDYDDEPDVGTNGATAAGSNGVAVAGATGGEGEKGKKNFSGIHSTGFR